MNQRIKIFWVWQINPLFIIVYLIIGFITGILSGLFGIGGGIVFLPSLFFILPIIGVDSSIVTVSAVATSLFAGSFASSSSLYNHWKQENISVNDGLLLGIGCIISAAIIPKFIVNLDPTILRYLIAFFILLVAFKMFFTKENSQRLYKNIAKKYLFLYGILFGGIAALSGFGGGVFYVPFLMYYFKGNLRLAVGTSTIAVVLTMLSAVISFAFLNMDWNANSLQFGYINLQAGLLLGIGAIIGAKFGVKFILKIPIPIFKKIFSVFLILSILKILQG